MILGNYFDDTLTDQQLYFVSRCESCHGQSERLLDSAKEMEDSIAVSLRSAWCIKFLYLIML